MSFIPAASPLKRILSLDGGGIRGIFALQVLARIEELMREHRGQPELVLADEFDAFAGTSTGAIIATGLSWGMAVRDIEALYVEHGGEIFARAPWYRRFHSKYRAEAIARFFQEIFCEEDAGGTPALLGSSRLRGLLILIMRNATTGSSWPLSNHPGTLFNNRSLPDCNLEIPLWQLLRASTAAPSFFPPQEIQIGNHRHLFVDGAVTPFNNPALLSVLMTLLPPYRIGWPAGRDRLQVVSVGTGRLRSRLAARNATQVTLFDQLGHVIPALIGSMSQQQDLLCRVLGHCVFGAEVDSEIGSLLEPTLLAPDAQLFTYVRYDQNLDALPGRKLTSGETAIDNLTLIPLLREIGRTYAAEYVRPEHLLLNTSPT